MTFYNIIFNPVFITDNSSQYNLINEKVVITGNLCISRGITISSEKMLLSHAIIPFTITDHSTAYQLAGRLCGNFKNLSNFNVPSIYITQKLKTIIFI